MLKRIQTPVTTEGAVIPVSQASYPAPFASELEFNAPVHGTWNIVHIGMLVAESQQIYVCAANCMRGVILTAAEMNASDRFSYVILEEQDLVEGTVEEITIEGVADVIEKLPRHPRAVMLFTVCLHHFLGCDIPHIYEQLRGRFPDIDFCECYMDPIMQKGGLTPDQKLRRSMYQLLRPRPAKEKTVTLLGSDFAIDQTGDLAVLLRENGYELRQITECDTYEDFLALAEAELFLSVYPAARYGAAENAKRLGRAHLYLPQCFGYEEISAHLNLLSDALHLPAFDAEAGVAAAEAALAETKTLVGDAPIAIDGTVHPRPLGLARLLLEHGFRVKAVYLDAISGEEKGDFHWLQHNAPELLLRATIQVKARVLPRGGGEKVLAVGQKAAWFENTPYFVNMVQGAGLWGFDGICRLCALMRQAFLEEKNTEDLVPRKGLGCESCV